MWLYESHLGNGIYAEEYPVPFYDLVCEQCGDADNELGNFNSVSDALKCLSGEIQVVPCDCGYCLDGILEELNKIFNENVTEEEARDIILKERAKWE